MSNEENTLFAGSSPAKRTNFVKMKNVFLILLGTVFLCGCMHHYDLTLANGKRITHVSKPKLDKETGTYSYEDVTGKKRTISAAKVVEIAPHSSQNVKAGMQQ